MYLAQSGQKSFTTISENLPKRIDQKKRKQSDFKHAMVATLVLS